MTDIFKDRVATALNDDNAADKWGKKGHTAVLGKIAKEIEKLPTDGGETSPSLTQLIANDMRHLVVQEAYELAEGVMKIHKPDLKDDQLKTETIELMLTLNRWCRQIA